MQRFALVSLGLAVALGGCLYNPTVEVDTSELDLARGTSSDVLVSIDGDEVTDLEGLYWTVDDPRVATVTPSYDGRHLRIGGDLEGETVVHISSYGQDLEIPTRVGPPAILTVWTEPARISAAVGSQVEVRAKAINTMAQVVDITFDSRWTIRDQSIANLDSSGMMLQAMEEGSTTLHVTHGKDFRVVPVSIFK
jgi:hypothetical protein